MRFSQTKRDKTSSEKDKINPLKEEKGFTPGSDRSKSSLLTYIKYTQLNSVPFSPENQISKRSSNKNGQSDSLKPNDKIILHC